MRSRGGLRTAKWLETHAGGRGGGAARDARAPDSLVLDALAADARARSLLAPGDEDELVALAVVQLLEERLVLPTPLLAYAKPGAARRLQQRFELRHAGVELDGDNPLVQSRVLSLASAAAPTVYNTVKPLGVPQPRAVAASVVELAIAMLDAARATPKTLLSIAGMRHLERAAQPRAAALTSAAGLPAAERVQLLAQRATQDKLMTSLSAGVGARPDDLEGRRAASRRRRRPTASAVALGRRGFRRQGSAPARMGYSTMSSACSPHPSRTAWPY